MLGDYHLQAGSPCIDAGDPNSPLDPDSTVADIGAFCFNQTVAVNHPATEEIPESCALHQPYPNPFNASTALSFKLQAASNIKLAIYDIAGRKVALLAEGYYPAGTHQAVWDASKVASGVYFARLEGGGLEKTRKLLLLR